MVAINFPDSPTNGQEHAGYVWDATNNVWNRLPTLPALDLIKFSAVAPTNPQDGQFWFDTTVGKMYVYYNDGSSSQWVSAIGGLASQTGTTGQVLTYDGTEWVADDPSGKILQVVSTTKTDTFTTASTSYTDITGLSVTITPRSTSSKILVLYSVMLGQDATSFGNLRLNRNSTAINIGDAASTRDRITLSGWTGGGESEFTIPSGMFLDSPNTTSSTTYKLQIRGTSANTQYVNRNRRDSDITAEPRGVSSITVIEVAG